MGGGQDRTRFRGLRRPAEAQLATVLAEALSRRGLTLSETREALAHRGQSVSLATLSYWRSGQRTPEGAVSFDVLDCLDEILHLEPGTLRASVGPGRRLSPGADDYVELTDLVRTGDAAGRALAAMGLEDVEEAVAKEYVMVAVDVDRRGQETRCVVRSRIRALRDGVDRRPLVIDAGEPLREVVTLTGTRGCRTGRTHVDLQAGLLVFEMLLERPLLVGETATFEYEVGLADTSEPETEFVWHCAHRVGEVEVWVRFDPARLPATAEVFTVQADGERRATSVDMDRSTSLVSAVRHFGPGTVGAAWTWPTPSLGTPGM
ncbi:hypothetical protein GCM10009737_01120 [Nocardioides lentus]|uniref:XRE family transcriptional regulator n=1 Tax=Nocardioides lentus TaxID=338077 RepID=A0ABP5A7T3_9ACTN